MSSKPSRRATIVDRLKKVLKPTRASTLPASSPSTPFVSDAVESRRTPAPRIYPLENKSEDNVARKWPFGRANKSSVSLTSSASLGQQPRRAKGARWYIPNETTIFPLPAPTHPAFHSQPISPISPISSSRGHTRRPSLSTSASSHGSSDLHTPKSAVESRPSQLWIPQSGAITPGYGQTTAYRDGNYFCPYDKEGREGPEFSPVSFSSGNGIGRSAEGVGTKPKKGLNLELRSHGWISKEVEAIEDGEMRRLTDLAFL